MSKEKENKEEYWVDDNLNPVFDKDFINSIDDHKSWEMTNELKYSAFISKNIEISSEELGMIKVYLSSIKDTDRLLELSRIITKNEEKLEVLENLYDIDSDPKTLRENLYTVYNEEFNVGKFIDIHIDSDLSVFLDTKNRNNKLEKLLS